MSGFTTTPGLEAELRITFSYPVEMQIFQAQSVASSTKSQPFSFVRFQHNWQKYPYFCATYLYKAWNIE
jgi:hypothetical protein